MKLAVHPQEGIGNEEGDPFIAIYERVVHGQAFQEGGGFLNEAIVVPYLGAHYGRLQPAGVAQPGFATKLADQVIVYVHGLLDSREVAGH